MRERHIPSMTDMTKAIIVSLGNQLMSLPIMLYLSPYCKNTENIYSLSSNILLFVFYTIIGDQWFYWTHRLMHCPLLYYSIHYYHHYWTYPIAISTINAHPIEHIIINIGSIVIGPLLYPCTDNILTIWIILTTFNAVSGHCGLHIPYLSIENHDMHHRLLTCNYGTSVLSDYMYGTHR